MERSFAQSVDVECPGCKVSFSAAVWLIVDAAERPDLVAQLKDDTLHLARCPNCGTEQSLDAPVLYHDGAAEMLVFAAQEQSTPAADQQVAQQLGQHLIAQIPLETRAQYLTTAHTVIGTAQLRQILNGEEAIESDALTEALQALMEAGDADEVRAVAAAHPVLAEPASRDFLTEYVRRLRVADQAELAVALEQRLAALEPAAPHPTLQFIQALLDAPSPDERRALLAARPHDVTPEVPTILEALADQAQRRHLDAVARDMLVIRDEVLGTLGRDVPITPSA